MDAFFLFKLICVTVIGLCVGSYVAALVWRLPRGVKGARSACPSCGHRLGVRDLVPVFSWIALRGRCRYCGGRIGAHYALIEAGTAMFFAAVYLYLCFEN